jgi:hypothetical protein
VGSSPFATALEAVLAPLDFAARDGFAHASRVRDLEETVARGARGAAELAIPDDLRNRFASLARAFEKPLEGQAREAAIRAALDALAPMAEAGFTEATLARSTAALPGVGSRRAETLARRGLSSVSDLLLWDAWCSATSLHNAHAAGASAAHFKQSSKTTAARSSSAGFGAGMRSGGSSQRAPACS